MPLSENAKKRPSYALLPWKEIPSFPAWEQASRAVAFAAFRRWESRSSPEILAIDSALKHYHQVVATFGGGCARSADHLRQEFEALVQLLEAVEVYLATEGHGTRRIAAVNNLKRMTTFTLADIRWQKLQYVYGGQPGTKPMVESVTSEPFHQGARVGHGPGSNQDPDAWLRGETDEKFLFQHLRKVREENNGVADNVRYVENSDRWKYLLVFPDTKLACQRTFKTKGQIIREVRIPVTTAGGDLGTCIYALDANGNLYMELPGGDGGQALNHCSFLEGRPVVCAGTIGITGGVVGYIDNASGHYRPNRQNLLRCLEVLRERIGDTYFAMVRVVDRSAAYPTAMTFANRFLLKRGACLPDGYYKSAKGRYDDTTQALVLFANNPQARANFLNQAENEVRNAALKKKITALKTALEGTKDKNLNIRPITVEERQLLKDGLTAGAVLIGELGLVLKTDIELKTWANQNGFVYL